MLTSELDAIETQLVEHLQQMPQFFLHAPVLVDLSEAGDEGLDLVRLAQLLREHRLVPVAVRNPTDKQALQAVAAGWGVLQSSLPATRQARGAPRRATASETPPGVDRAESAGTERRRRSGAYSDRAPEDDPESPLPGLTVRSPVRSGQVVHAVGGDLVVLAPVSSGAELIADGNIHVYAPLRGRALAGAQGNADVSIFCLGLEAEFLSIAGRYLRADQIDKKYRGRPARAHLSPDGLLLTSL
jgi:septum site-determining protein MinC